jgi:hypothetical protein
MSWRSPVALFAGIAGTISCLYMSHRDNISIEQDVESGQRAPSTAGELDHESVKEEIGPKTHELQTPIWYGLICSLARSSLFPRSRSAIADFQQHHRSWDFKHSHKNN